MKETLLGDAVRARFNIGAHAARVETLYREIWAEGA